MASESTEEETVTVHLPAELDDWLDEQAAELDVDRETVLVQVLASYRATAELDGEVAPEDVGLEMDRTPDPDAVKSAVQAYLDAHLREAVAEAAEDQIEAAVTSLLAEQLDERVANAVDEQVADRLSEATGAIQSQMSERVDEVEADYKEKLQDVRERVIQVKQEADAKAPADHDHEEFERFVALGKRVDEVEDEIAAVNERLDAALPEHETALEEMEERLDTVQDRLQTVAWVVSDVRDNLESGGGMEAVDRIKRAAAKEDVDRAQCESCGNGVDIALLTEPNCPHCESTVTDVEAASGFFGKAQLLVASQLESGEE